MQISARGEIAFRPQFVVLHQNIKPATQFFLSKASQIIFRVRSLSLEWHPFVPDMQNFFPFLFQFIRSKFL